MRKTCLFLFFGLFLLAGAGCSEGGGESVKCTTNDECPQGQQCIGGNCQLPGDQGPRTCNSINDCRIGEDCRNGICVVIQTEPDGGGEDGGDPADGGDLPPSDTGGDPGADPVRDQDTTDYSAFNFRVAVSRGGTSGPATQCVLNVHPVQNQGPVLPDLTLAGGYTINGTITGGSGADVSVQAEYPECVPAPVKADGSGRFAFYLPAGSHTLQAVLANRPVAYDTVNLQANTTRTLSFPAGTNTTGGPLFIGTPPDDVNLANWTVYAHYYSGAMAGKLAHPGVKTDMGGMYTVGLPVGTTYALLGYPPQGEPYPLQVLYPTGDPITPGDLDVGAYKVREGVTLSGQVTVGGAGTPGCTVDLVNASDPRLTAQATAATGGSYQILVRPASFEVEVMPSGAAFGQGALGYMDPQFSLVQNQTVDIDLVLGTKVTFTGRLLDTNGSGVSGANVRLFPVPRDVMEQDLSICNPAPVQTGADGSFSIACNLAP